MTMGALSLTGNAGKRNGAGCGSLCGVTHLPYDGAFGDDVDTLDRSRMMLSNNRPLASTSRRPSSSSRSRAKAASTPHRRNGSRASPSSPSEHGALIIVDDIQSGCGRSGTYFGFEGMDIEPDMVTQAKSLSGFGLPFAALLIKPEHDIWKPAEHNGTFRGNTHAFVTARVALEKFWKDDTFQTRCRKSPSILTAGLQAVADLSPGREAQGPRHDAGRRCRLRRARRGHLRALLRERPHHRDLGRRRRGRQGARRPDHPPENAAARASTSCSRRRARRPTNHKIAAE